MTKQRGTVYSTAVVLPKRPRLATSCGQAQGQSCPLTKDCEKGGGVELVSLATRLARLILLAPS